MKRIWPGRSRYNFDRLRFLDLDDHLRRREYRRSVIGDVGARGAVGGVIAADAVTGTGLDENAVTVVFSSRTEPGVRPTRGIRCS